jgi:hypothetical protein
MTDQEIEQHYNKLVEIYGDELPDPEVYPKIFAYFVKLYKRQLNEQASTTN